MTPAEYRALVADYSAKKIADPAGYLASVRAFVRWGTVMLGVAVLFFVGLIGLGVILIVSVSAGLGVFVGIPGLIGLYTLVAMSFYRPDRGEEREVTEKDAPALFRRLRELGEVIGSPNVCRVEVSSDLNASASTMTTFGLWGKHRAVVTLGLPLLCFFPQDEVDAILAHELAHHGNADPVFGFGIWRMQVFWSALSSQSDWRTFWVPLFARWYSPRLDAMTSILSREKEFAADAVAAKVVGAKSMGMSLIRLRTVEARTALLSSRRRDVERAGGSVDDPYRQAMAIAKERLEPMDPAELVVELKRSSSEDSSHPSLRERLEHLGWSFGPDLESVAQEWAVTMAEPVKRTALEGYCGGGADAYLASVEADFREQMEIGRAERLKDFEGAKKVYGDLRAKADSMPLTANESMRLVGATVTVEGDAAGKALMREVARRFPDDGDVQMMWAGALVHEKDPACLPILERFAMEPEYRYRALMQTSEYWDSLGESAAARPFLDAAHDVYADEAAKLESLWPVMAGDSFEMFEVPESDREALGALREGLSEVTAVYAVGKRHRETPHLVLEVYVIAFAPKGFAYDKESLMEKMAVRVGEVVPELSRYRIVLPQGDPLPKRLGSDGRFVVWRRE